MDFSIRNLYNSAVIEYDCYELVSWARTNFVPAPPHSWIQVEYLKWYGTEPVSIFLVLCQNLDLLHQLHHIANLLTAMCKLSAIFLLAVYTIIENGQHHDVFPQQGTMGGGTSTNHTQTMSFRVMLKKGGRDAKIKTIQASPPGYLTCTRLLWPTCAYHTVSHHHRWCSSRRLAICDTSLISLKTECAPSHFLKSLAIPRGAAIKWPPRHPLRMELYSIVLAQRSNDDSHMRRTIVATTRNQNVASAFSELFWKFAKEYPSRPMSGNIGLIGEISKQGRSKSR